MEPRQTGATFSQPPASIQMRMIKACVSFSKECLPHKVTCFFWLHGNKAVSYARLPGVFWGLTLPPIRSDSLQMLFNEGLQQPQFRAGIVHHYLQAVQFCQGSMHKEAIRRVRMALILAALVFHGR
jgi:hypothetical protein